MIATMAISQL